MRPLVLVEQVVVDARVGGHEARLVGVGVRVRVGVKVRVRVRGGGFGCGCGFGLGFGFGFRLGLDAARAPTASQCRGCCRPSSRRRAPGLGQGRGE